MLSVELSDFRRRCLKGCPPPPARAQRHAKRRSAAQKRLQRRGLGRGGFGAGRTPRLASAAPHDLVEAAEVLSHCAQLRIEPPPRLRFEVEERLAVPSVAADVLGLDVQPRLRHHRRAELRDARLQVEPPQPDQTREFGRGAHQRKVDDDAADDAAADDDAAMRDDMRNWANREPLGRPQSAATPSRRRCRATFSAASRAQ